MECFAIVTRNQNFSTEFVQGRPRPGKRLSLILISIVIVFITSFSNLAFEIFMYFDFMWPRHCA